MLCFGRVIYIYSSLFGQNHLCIVFCFGKVVYVLCFVLVMSFLLYACFGSVMHALCSVLVKSFMFCALSWRGHLYIVPCFGTVIYALFFGQGMYVLCHVLVRSFMYCALFGNFCFMLCLGGHQNKICCKVGVRTRSSSMKQHGTREGTEEKQLRSSAVMRRGILKL